MTTDLEALAETVPEHEPFLDGARLRRRVNGFAACLALHGDIEKAATQMGLSADDGEIVFKQICDDLGSQAR